MPSVSPSYKITYRENTQETTSIKNNYKNPTIQVPTKILRKLLKSYNEHSKLSTFLIPSIEITLHL